MLKDISSVLVFFIFVKEYDLIREIMIQDIVAMRQVLDRYKEMDYTFGSSRECKLLEDLTNDVENMNVDDFTEHVFDYDSISPLDPWKTT